MSAPPFMTVYVADYTADVQHLSCEQDGAYWRLLRAMWRAGGKLPSTPAKLARIAGLPDERWAEISRDVLALFVRRGGSLSHKRMASELQKYHSICERGSKGGKATAAKNASKTNDGEADQLGPSYPANDPAKPHKPQPQPQPERDNPPKPPKGAFEAFYAAYPLKKGKLQAEKNFAAAWARIEADTADAKLAVLLAGVTRFRAELHRRPTDKVAHPGTWLSAGRWMDEAPELFAEKRNPWAAF